ncbi:hypothetical protein NEFER03_0469 [Nematocida sp. LUAm3]|nr:hypothetical protein NEFER03_0469 [Nematocida sp. LUAm3]KAI5175926.1 hypothetical protein NEFER02_1786 [Nematocida sp. LUAm2]KAI5178692.1 hypothetical protein NEFER01_1811 [Nematocida sp. LUAm1]
MFRKDGRTDKQHRSFSVNKIEEYIEVAHGLNRVLSKLEPSTMQKKRLAVDIVIEQESTSSSLPQARKERKEEEYAKIIEDTFSSVLLEQDASYKLFHKIYCIDGSIISTLINSTSFVLQRYSVPIKYMVFSITCCSSKYKKYNYLSDLTEKEEKEKVPIVTVARAHLDYKEVINYVNFLNVEVPDALPLLEYSLASLAELSNTFISSS